MPEHLGLTPPIACSLRALTPAERERQALLRRQLGAAVAERQETSAGYRFVYRAEPGVAEAAAAWIPIERRCCPFLDFTFEWHAGHEGPSLEPGGRPGVKAFIADTFL